MIKTVRLFVFITFFFFASVSAEVAASEEGAQAFVNDLSTNALSIISSKKMTSDEKEKELHKLFGKSVDTEWMGKFVLGRYYRTTADKDRKRYQKLYHEYLIRSYVPKFRKYTNEAVRIIRVTKNSSEDYTVQTKLISSGGNDIRIDYRILENELGKFKVIDIVGEGISLITTQRSDFGGLISRKGVEYFIDKLESKVKKMIKGNNA